LELPASELAVVATTDSRLRNYKLDKDALGKKGIEKLGYTNEEGKINIQWKNITIITLLILVLILLFKSGMIPI